MPNFTAKQMTGFLVRCANGDCGEACPFFDEDECDEALMKAAAELIEEQADRIEGLARRNATLRDAANWNDAEKASPPEGITVLLTDGLQVDSGFYDAGQDAFEVDHAFIDPNEVICWKAWPQA